MKLTVINTEAQCRKVSQALKRNAAQIERIANAV